METNEELNRWAHSFLGKKMPEPEVCPLCNVSHASDKALFNKKLKALPDYCSEDSPRSLVAKLEAKAIEKVGKTVYFEHLCYVTQDATWRPEYEKREVAWRKEMDRTTIIADLQNEFAYLGSEEGDWLVEDLAEFILSLVTATALQRCTAARAAVEGI